MILKLRLFVHSFTFTLSSEFFIAKIDLARLMAFVNAAARVALQRGRPNSAVCACRSNCSLEQTGFAGGTASAVSRRSVLQGVVALSVSGPLLVAQIPAFAEGAVEADETEDFAEYRGPLSLGFSFRYPADWNVKKKPIKTHLSEVIVSSNKAASTSAGLVVDMVKINSIENFGTAQDVGKKVVDLEMKKDSVSNAQLLSSMAEKKDPNGLTYYLVDYTVESSRGAKHYLAKATITAQQLYVFTAQSKTDDFEGETETILKRMVDSFTVKPQYT